MPSKLSVRRVRSEEERNVGNANYIRLSETGEKFVGTALFNGDPTEDEPGYYEFFQHYHPVFKSVPCSGEDCPLCEDGDRPRGRAQTVWVVDGEAKIFEMNALLISQFTEMRGEGEKILGRKFRVARLDDKGNYQLFPKEVEMKKGEVVAALKEADFDLEGGLLNNLKRKREQMGVAKALTDDDDGAPTTKAKAGTAKKKKVTLEPELEAKEEFDKDTVTVESIEGNTITVDFEGESYLLYGTDEIDVTDLSEGDEVQLSAIKDDEDDFVISSLDAVTPSTTSNDEELPDKIEDEVFVITEVDAEAETLTLENDDLGLTFPLYFLNEDQYDGTEVDFDDYKVGMKITLNAVKDSDGDMCASSIPGAVKAKGKAKAKAK